MTLSHLLRTATALADAIGNERPVQITYRAADGQETTRVIEPYELDVTRAGHRIVRAMDRRSAAPRCFRIDRILALAPQDGPFLLDRDVMIDALSRIRAEIAGVDPEGYGYDAMRWTPSDPIFIP